MRSRVDTAIVTKYTVRDYIQPLKTPGRQQALHTWFRSAKAMFPACSKKSMLLRSDIIRLKTSRAPSAQVNPVRRRTRDKFWKCNLRHHPCTRQSSRIREIGSASILSAPADIILDACPAFCIIASSQFLRRQCKTTPADELVPCSANAAKFTVAS